MDVPAKAADTAVAIQSDREQQAITPPALLQQAIAAGNTELASKLMDLMERWEKNQARKAFDEAIADAKAEIPPVIKNRAVDFTSAKGRTNYRYEDLAEIARTIDHILGRHGLSYRYRTSSPTNEPVTVTCIVSHRMGHSEENTLSAGRDDTGNKNSIQAIGSTVTFLQRYTLKAALGLAASNDDDANAVGNESITDEQRKELEKALAEVGGTKTPALAKGLLKYLKVASLAELPSSKFEDAKAAIEAKRGKV